MLLRVEAFDQRLRSGRRHVEQGRMQRVLVEVADELFRKLQRRQRFARPIVHRAQVVPAGAELHVSFAVDAVDDLHAAFTAILDRREWQRRRRRSGTPLDRPGRAPWRARRRPRQRSRAQGWC